MHISTQNVLKRFDCSHIQHAARREFAEQFKDVADQLALVDSIETTVALRKLLESKDAAINAMIIGGHDPIQELSMTDIVELFVFDHLPEWLQPASEQFVPLSDLILGGPKNVLGVHALLMLKESKDAAVRAMSDAGEPS